jgi:hypothetical protein
MPQFGASLADDARVVIYACYMFIIQATGITNIFETSGKGILVLLVLLQSSFG